MSLSTEHSTHASCATRLPQDELSLLCEARFSKLDMCNVETHLLRIVGWELNPPNPFTFARDFVHALALPDADVVIASVTELLKAVAEGVSMRSYSLLQVPMRPTDMLTLARL